MDFQTRYQYHPTTDLLSKGSFSRVFKAHDMLLDRDVALKVFNVEVSAKRDLAIEIKKAITLDHTNLCRYYDAAFVESSNALNEPEKHLVAVSEYINGGELISYCKAHPESLDKLLVDVLQGLAFLHKNNIVHRKLTPQNILVKNTTYGPVATIIDFGISNYRAEQYSISLPRMNTLEYMAPEQLIPQKYGINGHIGTNLDLWSFGVIVYELATFGLKLFPTGDTEETMASILNDEQASLKLSELSEPYRKIAQSCLVKDASKRAQRAGELIEMLNGNKMGPSFDFHSSTEQQSQLEKHAMPFDDGLRRVSQRPMASPPRQPKENILAHIADLLLTLPALIFGAPSSTSVATNYDTPTVVANENTLVEVFYTTDRLQNKSSDRITYSGRRGPVSYGSCEVSIPQGKKIGEIPRLKIWKFEFNENPDKHMLIVGAIELNEALFFDKVSSKINVSDEHDAFVFIHGFNVSFDDSVLRAAQIAYDLNFVGAPIVYSWPSPAKTLLYMSDEDNIRFTVPHLIQFLKDVKNQTKAKKIHIIAHSMGNRALTDTLVSLQQEKFFKGFAFNQIILAAPDIDAQVFVEYIAPKITRSSKRITLYTSAGDVALTASKKLRGGMISRLGLSGSRIVVFDGIDTVDASNIDTDFMGHGYFAETAPLINDLYLLIRHNHSPAQRNLIKKVSASAVNWEFKKA